MLFKAIFYGYLWGFVMCFTLGPAFFTVLYFGLQKEAQKAKIFTLGVLLADLLLSIVAIYASNLLAYSTFTKVCLTILSAIFLLAIGIGVMRSNLTFTPKAQVIGTSQLIASGFLLNISNPMNTLFFVSTTATLRANYFTETAHLALFFISSLLATYMASLLIVYVAQKLSTSLHNKYSNWLKYGIGSFFIGLSIKLLFSLF
jgi:threonine/homoserine/homoserine lactone efflux protein